MSKEKKPSKEQAIICLSCNGQQCSVSLAAFGAISNSIRLDPPTEKLLFLDEFDKRSILDFLPQFIESRRLSGRMSFAQMADLLQISSQFEIPTLTTLLEQELLGQARKSTEHLVQAFLVAEKINIGCQEEVLELATTQFIALSRTASFQLIPPGQFMRLITRCTLGVDNELELVDAALFWLCGQPMKDQLANVIFSLIRSSSLDSASYVRIIQRVIELNFSEKTRRFISAILTSSCAARICSHPFTAGHRCCADDPIPCGQKMLLSQPKDDVWLKTRKMHK